MNVLHFAVPGDPVAWSRTKGGTNPKTGRRVAYNPKRMVRKEHDIWIACRRAMIEQGFPKVTGAVALFVLVKFKRPKCGECRIWHTQRPDFDNCGKIVPDALNGVAWDDDCQVVGGPPFKVWTDGEPGLDVWILVLSEVQEIAFANLRLLSDQFLTRAEAAMARREPRT